MIPFGCDYNFGAHPAVLRRLEELNATAFPGYGEDELCRRAGKKILARFGCPGGEVYFLAGGTQTNQLVIDTLLAPYEGVIAPDTGHISAHEAGAVEFTGHKVLALPAKEGKLDAAAVARLIDGFRADPNHAHMVFPGMVYISYPTEYGTLYSKEELAALSAVCRSRGVPLYIDGARLGYGLAADVCDVTPEEFAAFADVFYAGGTKMGALYGEALVFPHGGMPAHFATRVKQHGAMLAKGWLIGAQFEALFEDDLYFRIGRHAEKCAARLEAILRAKGYAFYLPRQTNQLFVILDDDRVKALAPEIGFGFWEKPDEDRTVVRLAVSWATDDEMLRNAEALL